MSYQATAVSDLTTVECTHCGVLMGSHSGGGGSIRYFHCPCCNRWMSTMYTEVLRADTKMRQTEAPKDDSPFSHVKERLQRWLSSLSDQSAYKVLGATPLDSDETLREKYRRLAKQLHPDVGGDPAKMQRLNDAYDIIRRQRSPVARLEPALASGL